MGERGEWRGEEKTPPAPIEFSYMIEIINYFSHIWNLEGGGGGVSPAAFAQIGVLFPPPQRLARTSADSHHHHSSVGPGQVQPLPGQTGWGGGGDNGSGGGARANNMGRGGMPFEIRSCEYN